MMFLILAPLLAAPALSADRDGDHIEEWPGMDVIDDVSIVIMRCGLVVRVFDDGSTAPANVDWYGVPINEATCPGCRRACGF